MKKIRFESDFAHNLYIEVSALRDVSKLRRTYITVDYIWKIWRKVYLKDCGCTRYFLLPDEGRGEVDG